MTTGKKAWICSPPLGARGGIVSVLAGQAAALHASGDDDRAVRLFGSAEKALGEAGMAFATVARAESSRYREAARQAVGKAAYQAGRPGE